MYATKKSFAFNPDKTLEKLAGQFLEGEDVLALFTLMGNGSGFGIISAMRLAFFKIGEVKPHVSVPMDQIQGYEFTTKLGTNNYSLKLADGSFVKLGAFLRDDEKPVLEILDDCIANPVVSENASLDTPDSRDAEFTSIEANFPWTKVPKHLQKNVMANVSAGEKPLFIISSNAGSSAGSLVAMTDRCILIKSGAMGGLLSGTLGGARVSSFYYRDITGIEYNSGLIMGVVEILTASYSGTANKDFWKGTTKGRNSDSNDPWTLSNTLPLSKLDYASAKPQFDKLRALLSESKNATSHTTVVQENSVADEIEKLSGLLAKGIIDEAEFKEAKKKLLGL
jgi:hypothetical protein